MKYWEATSEVPNVEGTQPTPAEDFLYVPGIKIPMADALSRISPQQKGEIKALDVTIHEPTSEQSACIANLGRKPMEKNTPDPH